VDKAKAAEWLDRYVDAWKTYEVSAIADLFSEEAEYRYHPYDEPPVRGRDAIAADWLDERDEPGTFEASYAPVAVDGDVVVATGTSTYRASDGKPGRTYDNCFVMRFDDSGRCSSFTEWYMERPR
jgi:ketosteroid isomerase-like protein